MEKGKGLDELTEKELIDLFNGNKTLDPGTVDLHLNDGVHRFEASNKKPQDEWSVGDWTKFMDSGNSNNKNAVDLDIYITN